ncbi:MAG: signal peptidase II [bacterium P3]|nr:MAG: signal peptidase II [bacterium P3]KWW42354.1 MAG: signal peptidase II [bacterium F083]
MSRRNYWLCFSLITVILILDQALKIWVKTTLRIGEEIPLIGDWCLLHFVENEGMAFGMAFGGRTGKIALTLFRLVASAAICCYLVRLIHRDQSRTSLLVSVSLIFVGAVGNVIDSCFYGLIFNESYYEAATLFPTQGGYAPFLQGRVVDMFYFPLIDSHWPSWIPWLGGRRLVFFNAIFNIADAAITVGVVWLIIDQFIAARRQKNPLPPQTQNIR